MAMLRWAEDLKPDQEGGTANTEESAVFARAQSYTTFNGSFVADKGYIFD